MDSKKLLDIVEKQLTPQRYYHTICVAQQCVQLAKRFGEDTNNAEIAGIVHDVMKNHPPNYLLQYLQNNGIILNNVEKASPQLWHAMAGAVYAKNQLHIQSIDIQNAIRYHTTARKGMSRLEKIVFVADCISADRTFEGVQTQREYAQNSLDMALLFALTDTIMKLCRAGKPLHLDTVQAYNEISLTITEV